MATWVSKTCWWPLCNKITSMKPSAFVDLLVYFMRYRTSWLTGNWWAQRFVNQSTRTGELDDPCWWTRYVRYDQCTLVTMTDANGRLVDEDILLSDNKKRPHTDSCIVIRSSRNDTSLNTTLMKQPFIVTHRHAICQETARSTCRCLAFLRKYKHV